MNFKKINFNVFASSLIIVYIVALIGSLFARKASDSLWYNSIKPSITPPNWVFSVVWSILFFLIAISLYLALTSSKNKSKKIKISELFAVNFILNISWSFLFFTLKSPLYSFIILVLLIISAVMIMLKVYKTSRASAYLLIPYVLWLIFAGVLNFLIVFLTWQTSY